MPYRQAQKRGAGNRDSHCLLNPLRADAVPYKLINKDQALFRFGITPFRSVSSPVLAERSKQAAVGGFGSAVAFASACA